MYSGGGDPFAAVVLSPTGAEEADDENALAGGDALIVGPLEAQEGTQSYDLPAGPRPIPC